MSALQGLQNQRQRLSRIAEQRRDERRRLAQERFNEQKSGGSQFNHVKKERSGNDIVFTTDGRRIKLEDTAEDEVRSLPSFEFHRRGETNIDNSANQKRSPRTLVSSDGKQTGRPTDVSSPADVEHGPSPHSHPNPNSTPGPDKSNRPRCTCPVGRNCEAKTNELVDCRTLVLETKAWDNWISERKEFLQSSLPPNVTPEDEEYMTLQEMQDLLKILHRVEIRPPKSVAIRREFENLQAWILKAQTNSVTQEVLQESMVLTRLEEFLSEDYATLRESKRVHISIVENLTIIYRKWELGDLSVVARRGLIQNQERGLVRADDHWPYARSADYFGHGHLVNGQTWRSRAEMRRDGAHAPPISGIYGTAREGAKSVVMGYHDESKKDYYADIDEGDTIFYMGTALARAADDEEATNIKDRQSHTPGMTHLNRNGRGPTSGTQALITSSRTKRPVRVFRSSRLADIVTHKPVQGYRYDGLYKVVGYEVLKLDRQIYRFGMVRVENGQGPLRENLPPPAPTHRKRRRHAGEISDED
ncbi:uncharacterized protein A1O9_00221 [Exophiala aquamarina CBS 119918]|uniref:YDG domain-containing protein n=1 Tax=Exophiala aquamarina CBS 119918 TaxID=1182545 RepID=A0A072PQ71_9EURO|nr:uncharacterized protein A1O9_00221 [Exophiala aquamarina CBS 119918]KEF62249.1 hypothetical protein A1O9_00221 [Exophiala aquamarina CBS 119918]